jgi:hypothetical protein
MFLSKRSNGIDYLWYGDELGRTWGRTPLKALNVNA